MTESTRALPTTTPLRPGFMGWFRQPRVREAMWGFVFIGPWLIGLLLFTAGPMIASFVMSFTNFDLVRPEATRFIGIDNYVRMASDPMVAKSLIATFKFALISIPVTMIASLAFAVLLNSPRLAWRGPMRTLVYMPIMIPLVASTLVWIGFLNTDTGWMNQILAAFGIPRARTGSTARSGSTRRSRSSACGASATSC